MPSNEIRAEIKFLIDDLNKLRNNIDDVDQQKEIQVIIRPLMAAWKNTILDSLEVRSSQYQNAQNFLQTAQDLAKEALNDARKVAKAIQTATKVAKAVDTLLKLAQDKGV